MYTDGGSRGNPGPAGAGAFVCNDKGELIRKAHLFLGTVTNNEAEYQAVILGLETLKKVFGKEKIKDLPVEIRMDSELICKQLRGEYQVKEEKLVPFFMKIWNARVADFHNLSFVHIPREQNAEADKLANQAMDEGSKDQKVLF
jgi:ribonuclease HI